MNAVTSMATDTSVVDGVVRDGAIMLANGPSLPEGARVRVTVVPSSAPTAAAEIERLCAKLRSSKTLQEI